MQYEVRALSGDTIQSLLVDAISDEDAARVVSERQLTAISIKRIKNGAGWLAPRGSRFDLVLFSIELMELLDAGLGVVEAVDALSARQRDSETTRVFARLLERLRVGVSFSAALAQSADLFPPIYIGLVRAAERTSDLKGALGRYLEYRSRFDALRARVVSALIYPVILLCVGSAVTLFLMVWVMPRFSAVFDTSGHNMPILSRLLIDWGHLVSQYRLELTSSVVALIAALFVISYRAFHTGSAETLLVFFPALQERVNTFRISRLYLTLGTLLNGGMPALQALEMAEGVLPKAMLPRLQQVAEDLRGGESIATALERQALTTPVALRLLQAGEGAGRLGEMLVRAARYHDNELGRWMERFVKLFEPILMVIVGGVVGVIVVMLYLPIFQLAEGIR